MKILHKTVHQRIACFASGFLAIILLALSAAAQSNSPQGKQGDIWKVGYRVSVEGDFSTKPEPGKEGPTVFYHIKRIYTGTAKLSFSNKHSNPNLDAPLFKDPHAAVRIEVDDFVNSLEDPTCDEYESSESSCKGLGLDSDAMFPVPALLMIDNTDKLIKTSFPILFISPSDRSFGDVECISQNFDNPGHKPNGKPIKKELPFSSFDPPAVGGFIKDGSIQQTLDWSKLKSEGISLTWTSGVLHPDQPLIDGVPESKDQVGIVITYDITRAN